MASWPTLSDQDVIDIAGLIYARWSESFERLDKVKVETDDGSPDWQAFHEDRLTGAKAEEAKWLSLRDRYNEENRAAINRAFGL